MSDEGGDGVGVLTHTDASHITRKSRAERGLIFQHSPSSRAQAESIGKMFDLGRGEGLGQGVGNHVIGRTVDEAERAVLDDLTDEMIPYVDMLRARVILVVLSERNCGLIVAEQNCGGVERREDLTNK